MPNPQLLTEETNPITLLQSALNRISDLERIAAASGGLSGGVGNGNLVYALGTPVAVTNTTTETDLFSYNVIGNTLGLVGALRVRAYLTQKQNVATNPTITFKIKFGATTILSIAEATWGAATANLWNIFYEFWIRNNGATNVQVAGGLYLKNPAVPLVASLGSPLSGAEDTTADKALALSVIHPTANANYITTLQAFEIYKISNLN